jgi:3-oxoacyl-[acyl-carrier-protein] synthase II
MAKERMTRMLADYPVVITGIGAVSAAGPSAGALWQAAAAGRATAAWREFEWGGHAQRMAVCAVPPLENGYPEMQLVRRMDRCAHLGWMAAREAWTMAGLKDGGGRRAGLFLGTSRGPLSKLSEGFARLEEPRYPPSLSADCTTASISGALAQGLGITGPVATVSATCASAAFAIALAAEQILLGKTDVMLAGGAEAPLVPVTLAQLKAAGVLGYHDDPARTCRPFDVTRNGLCLGEGSAFLVLESAESALRRGAVVLASLSGWGTGVDASGRTGVGRTGEQLVAVVTEALEWGGLAIGDIDAVNAHGTGTELNDVAEANGLCRLLGRRVSKVPCTSTKPVTGHCLGATPALEAVICVESLRRGLVPPAANCLEQDVRCGLRIPKAPLPMEQMRHVLSTSLGFWGYHAVLVFSIGRI